MSTWLWLLLLLSGFAATAVTFNVASKLLAPLPVVDPKTTEIYDELRRMREVIERDADQRARSSKAETDAERFFKHYNKLQNNKQEY